MPNPAPYKSNQFKDKDNLIPTIITSKTKPANIDKTRAYLCKSDFLKDLSTYLKIDYDSLISGDYKLVVEPIAYFTYNGRRCAMTATEVALYDQLHKGKVRARLASMSHKNLPFAMFLQRDDLGVTAWKGPTSAIQSNATILSRLGIGVVSFTDPPIVQGPEADVYIKGIYRTDTDVITSVRVRALDDITPPSKATITLSTENGYVASTSVTIPSGESQLVWVRWHTPKTPGTVQVTAKVSGNASAVIEGKDGSMGHYAVIDAVIEDIHSKLPPHPTADDLKPSGFMALNATLRTQRSSANWTIWKCKWVENWVEHSSTTTNADGSTSTSHWYVDEGWWEFDSDTYTATVDAKFTAAPDDKVPTKSGDWMRSGYGVKEKMEMTLYTNAPLDQVTGAQNALTYYPEFGFKTYRRPMQITEGFYSTLFELASNKYSTYERRVHFTPVWYPDGIYDVYVEAFDLWTPDGMLSQTRDDYVLLKGSVWDDWHIGIASDLIR